MAKKNLFGYYIRESERVRKNCDVVRISSECAIIRDNTSTFICGESFFIEL